MKVKTLDERTVTAIGHAFGYYDYGGEHGLIDAFPSREAVAAFIRGYVRMAFQSGMLYATSERARATSPTNAPAKKSGPVPRCRWPGASWGP